MISVYTLWVALKEDPSSFWMLKARDEFSWEGDPDDCEKEFSTAKKQADADGLIWREITLKVPGASVESAFEASQIEVTVE